MTSDEILTELRVWILAAHKRVLQTVQSYKAMTGSQDDQKRHVAWSARMTAEGRLEGLLEAWMLVSPEPWRPFCREPSCPEFRTGERCPRAHYLKVQAEQLLTLDGLKSRVRLRILYLISQQDKAERNRRRVIESGDVVARPQAEAMAALMEGQLSSFIEAWLWVTGRPWGPCCLRPRCPAFGNQDIGLSQCPAAHGALE